MDNFLDKLSQKLNAQEMIRANGQAETEQIVLLKTQVKEYQSCLDRMQEVCGELGNLEGQISALSVAPSEANAEEFADIKKRLELLADENSKQIKALQDELGEKLAGGEFFDKMGQDILEKVGSGDDIHKECVKVYRNVQAVVVEESTKLRSQNEEEMNTVKNKIASVKGIAITALVFSIIAAVCGVLNVLTFFFGAIF